MSILDVEDTGLVHRMHEHGPCRGMGCDHCCGTGRDVKCTVCLDKGNVFCELEMHDGQGRRRAWLCFECYRWAWLCEEILQGEVLVAPLMAHELAQLTDKGTAT